jgi:anti-sigma regulatory factor (Ser/Thr protein kinase)
VEIVRTLSAAPTAPSEARRSLLPLGGVLPPDRFDDLLLVVSELVTNAVLHAGLGKAEAFVLRVEVAPPRIRVEVADPGSGFLDVSKGPTDVHGRGLGIVARLAERWGTESKPQTKVWAEMTIR